MVYMHVYICTDLYVHVYVLYLIFYMVTVFCDNTMPSKTVITLFF